LGDQLGDGSGVLAYRQVGERDGRAIGAALQGKRLQCVATRSSITIA
jgi:hypothetical protein